MSVRFSMSVRSIALRKIYGYRAIILFVSFFLPLVIGLLVRIFEITDRPLHSDEGVNFFFADKTLRDGFYHYSYQNYHGPTYFYLLTFFHYFFGSSELWHRMPAILPGVLTVVIPYFLRKIISFRAVIFVALFFCFSTSMVYHSRYSIHETLLVLVSLWFVFSLFRWMERRESSMLIHLGIGLSLLIGTKETFIITGFSLFVVTFLLYDPRRVLRQLSSHLTDLYWGFFFCLLILLLFYSGFFHHSESLRELFMGVPQWVGRGHSDTGHHKPYWYYFQIMKDTEPLVFLSLGAILFWLYRIAKSFYCLARHFMISLGQGFSAKGFWRRLPRVINSALSSFYNSLTSAYDRVMVGVALYALVSFLVYSYVPYKTPWLIINMSAPAIMSGTLFVLRLRPLLVSNILLVFCLCVSVKYMLEYNFSYNTLSKYKIGRLMLPYLSVVGSVNSANPFSYVHTTQGMLDLVADIDSYMNQYPGRRIVIGTQAYWPLPYYLRKYSGRAGYGYTAPPEQYFPYNHIMILDHTEKIENPDWKKKYYRLADHIESNVYFYMPDSETGQ